VDGSFGALLQRHRLAAGLTQEGLAERAGVSSQAVGALERGDRRFPHRRTIDLLADALALADDERVRFTAAARRPSTPVRKRPANGTPRQLPPGIAHFTGRAREVTTIIGLLEQVTAVAVSAVAGMGGVGKTSLAIHVGHLLADRFPDGQVYLDLRGPSSPLPAREALGQVVRALGIADDELPADTAEAAARYRTYLAGRRVLLVLDNAAGADQVLPLLPASPGSAAIVTSRHALHALPQLHTISGWTSCPRPRRFSSSLRSSATNASNPNRKRRRRWSATVVGCRWPSTSPAPGWRPGLHGRSRTWPYGWPTNNDASTSWNVTTSACARASR